MSVVLALTRTGGQYHRPRESGSRETRCRRVVERQIVVRSDRLARWFGRDLVCKTCFQEGR